MKKGGGKRREVEERQRGLAMSDGARHSTPTRDTGGRRVERRSRALNLLVRTAVQSHQRAGLRSPASRLSAPRPAMPRPASSRRRSSTDRSASSDRSSALADASAAVSGGAGASGGGRTTVLVLEGRARTDEDAHDGRNCELECGGVREVSRHSPCVRVAGSA
jgi:hypothetical protein